MVYAFAPSEGLHVGLSSTILTSAETPVTLVTGVLGAVRGFTSDKAGYMMIENNGTLKLAVAPAFLAPDFTLPVDAAVIEESAFEGANMSVAFIPDGCEIIGDHAFKDCLSLTQIRIPYSCALGADVFDGCGTVFVFGTAGSAAEAYCAAHDNCVFVAE